MNIKEMSIDEFKKEVEAFLDSISEEEILDGIEEYVDNLYYNTQKIVLTTDSDSEMLIDRKSGIGYDVNGNVYTHSKEKYDYKGYKEYTNYVLLGDVA